MTEPVIHIQVFKPRRRHRPLTRALRWTLVAMVAAALAGAALLAAWDYGQGALVAGRELALAATGAAGGQASPLVGSHRPLAATGGAEGKASPLVGSSRPPLGGGGAEGKA